MLISSHKEPNLLLQLYAPVLSDRKRQASRATWFKLVISQSADSSRDQKDDGSFLESKGHLQ